MDKWPTVYFEELLEQPLRSGINAPSRVRGSGVKLVNMGELFANDRLGDVPMELAPLPSDDSGRYLLQAGDLLFARQSLKLEGAGRCCYVMPSDELRTWEGHIIRARLRKSAAQSAFFYYWFRSPSGRAAIASIVEQVAAAGIRGSDLARLRVPCPPINEQGAIAEVLSALDDKVDSNCRIRTTARQLGMAAVHGAIADAAWTAAVEDLTRSVARGISPTYATSGPLVLNQRCVRDGFVDTRFAKQMVPREVSPDKVAREGDVLVNSTGVGTLGRVARWQGQQVFVDGHVTVVRPDARLYPPTVLAYCLMRNEPKIETLGDGTTGQTELSRERLRSFALELPERKLADRLEPQILEFEHRAEAAARESETLRRLRDLLLAELLSGRLRVPVAEDLLQAAP